MCQCNPERMLKYCGKGKCVDPINYTTSNISSIGMKLHFNTDISKEYAIVLGQKIPIIEKKFSDDTWGEFDNEKMTIFISPSSPRRNQIIFHEMIHAALYISGVDRLLSYDLEEAICSCLENLYHVEIKTE